MIGVGRLGWAILSYPGFVHEGFEIVAALDSDSSIIGTVVGELQIRPLDDLGTTSKQKKIDIDVIVVPSTEAQEVMDKLVARGVKAILNYAPFTQSSTKDKSKERRPGHLIRIHEVLPC